MSHQNIKLSRIEITGDIRETDSPYQYGDELNELLQRTHAKVMSRKMKNPQPLLKLISKHSNVPAFRNYLFNLYNLAGKKEKAQAVNQRLMEKFPDYIFGKINHAVFYLVEQQYEKIPEVIGEALTLDGLCPGRKVFHLSEFKSFESLVVNYLLRTQRLEAANSHINICEEVLGFRDPVVRNLRNQYKELMAFQHLLQYQPILEKREKEGDYFRGPPLPEQVTKAPQLTHEELWILYQKDTSIEPELLKQILKLPRESLIADLETIIIDAAQRKQAIEKELEGKSWEEAPVDFLLHAIALLTELGAKAQMPLVLKTLSYSDNLVDYYLDIHLTETLWQFFYRLYQNDPSALYAFMASPEYGYEAKTPVMEALTQVGIRHPERKQEVIDYYDQFLGLFIDHLDNPDISDVELMSATVGEAIALKAVNLLPKIKILMELGLIDEMFYGDFEMVSEEMTLPRSDRAYDYFPNIFELYKDINETWGVEKREKEERHILDILLKEFEEEKRELKAEQNRFYREETVEPKPFFPGKKIGRNESCPCGSGKKYKRCCLNKV